MNEEASVSSDFDNKKHIIVKNKKNKTKTKMDYNDLRHETL